jgi:hypothetical protein
MATLVTAMPLRPFIAVSNLPLNGVIAPQEPTVATMPEGPHQNAYKAPRYLLYPPHRCCQCVVFGKLTGAVCYANNNKNNNINNNNNYNNNNDDNSNNDNNNHDNNNNFTVPVWRPGVFAPTM